jgi:GntR family transcriptional regulator/MocR family aminotransferase
MPLISECESNAPLFLQIAQAAIADIRGGRLLAGEKLPGSRSLASGLGIHRNTVLSAYDELIAQGWIETERGRGTYVSADLPESIKQGRESRISPGYSIRKQPLPNRMEPEPQILSMAGGLPDIRAVDASELARSLRRALKRAPRRLDYGSPFGAPSLRRALVTMLKEKRGMLADESEILITRGSQMGIYLLSRVLLRPGDLVAVEAMGYQAAWRALKLGGAKLRAVAIDEEGMDVAALESLHRRQRVKAVYLTPHHQFPTLVTLSAARRQRLLDFARREKVAVIEDDYDHEFQYAGRPVLPMASNDTSGNVIYLGTFSKVFAPGLRVGYVKGPPELIEAMAALRSHIDGHGDAITESAIAEWIEEGELERHARRARKLYRERQSVLAEDLECRLAGALRFDIPAGGMALWVRSIGQPDVDGWAERALAAGVRFSPASIYRLDGRKRPYMRLGFAKLEPHELRRSVEILARTMNA